MRIWNSSRPEWSFLAHAQPSRFGSISSREASPYRKHLRFRSRFQPRTADLVFSFHATFLHFRFLSRDGRSKAGFPMGSLLFDDNDRWITYPRLGNWHVFIRMRMRGSCLRLIASERDDNSVSMDEISREVRYRYPRCIGMLISRLVIQESAESNDPLARVESSEDYRIVNEPVRIDAPKILAATFP